MLGVLNNAVMPALQSLDDFLVTAEPLAEAPIKDLEDAVESVEQFLSGTLIPQIQSVDSGLQTLIGYGQTAVTDLNVGANFLAGPVFSFLTTVGRLLDTFENALSSGQTGLSTLQDGIVAVEKALAQKVHETSRTITYPNLFVGLAGPYVANIVDFLDSVLPLLSNPLFAGLLLEAAPDAQPSLASPPTPITATDPRLPVLLGQAEQQWAAATGSAFPVAVTLVVAPLDSGVLAESEITARDSQGHATAGVIVISSDAAGRGWYLGDASTSDEAFAQALTSGAFAAQPGSAAYGRFDLLTTLEHEFGHILAFDPSSPGYEGHLQIINGTQYFVGAGFRVAVAPGGELDPSFYPNDVIAATLEPGVRKSVSDLDLAVVNTLWGGHLDIPVIPPDGRGPVAPTTVVDHVIEAIASTGQPDNAASVSSPAASVPSGNISTTVTRQKGHHAKPKPKTKHPVVVHAKKHPVHKVKVVTPAQHKTPEQHVSHTPHAGLAVQLSRKHPSSVRNRLPSTGESQ